MDAVGAVGSALHYSVEELDGVAFFGDGYSEVFGAWEGVAEFGHLVVVGCEESFAAERGAVVDEFGYGSGDGETVVGGGAASDFVEDC